MPNQLSYEQTQEIQQAIKEGYFLMDDYVKKLIDQGFEKDTAVALLQKQYKQALFESAKRQQKQKEEKGVAIFAVIMVSAAMAVFEVTSPIWLTVLIAIAGLAGYWGNKEKPIAGVMAFILFAISLPFTVNFYLKGRSSYLNLELLIPIAIAAAPAALIFLILSKLVYPKESNVF